jgi:hypothetical protein
LLLLLLFLLGLLLVVVNVWTPQSRTKLVRKCSLESEIW